MIPKFRGLTKDGKWVKGFYCSWQGIELIFNSPWNLYHRPVEVIPETVSWCTGFKDKNGVEIFFNDLVKYEDSMGVRIGVILWDGDFCHICIEFNGKTKSRRYGGKELFRDCEVVGNIHQNKDLLEKT